MKTLEKLLEKNRSWHEDVSKADPEFFSRLARQQSPEYLWIGCSDSRVPANQIVGLDPGELFVHRNVANLVVHTDLNCLSVMQFAVEALKVKHIIVCGHYNCGGVKAALHGHEMGLIDNWLRHIQDIQYLHESELAAIESPAAQCDVLCELNVVEQVSNVCRTTIVQDAWRTGHALSVHGWIYDINDGRLRDLSVHVSRPDELRPAYDDTIKRILSSPTIR